MDNEKKWLFGPRKTTDKPTAEMCSYELMLNNCYVENKNAMYRDFDESRNIRSFIRDIAKSMRVYLTDDPELLDMALFDYLDDELDTTTGVLGLLYSLLWSKAELYEKLKRYEDAEERGEIGRVPRWIPVTPETMPKNMTEVITYDGTHNIVSTHVYDGEGFRAVRCADGTWAHDCCITHWMPLPEPPEVSENAP